MGRFVFVCFLRRRGRGDMRAGHAAPDPTGLPRPRHVPIGLSLQRCRGRRLVTCRAEASPETALAFVLRVVPNPRQGALEIHLDWRPWSSHDEDVSQGDGVIHVVSG